MSILDLHGDDVMAAAARYVAPPKPEPESKFSTWRLITAVPRGAAEAGMQVLASGAELATAGAYMRDTPTKDMPAGVPAEALQSDLADSLRERGREFRPDPQTAHVAEEVLYGFARGATKIVAGALAAGPLGVLAAGVEEGMTQADELKRQGVTDPNVRAEAGAVQGAGLALAVLPVLGGSLKATAWLYLAGGPGGFIAQQALTREILRGSAPDGIAEQFDPFDPVGLAVSSLIPAGFAAWGIRGQRKAAAAKAAEDFRTGPVPSEPAPVADAVRAAYSPEVVDAARVAYAVESRAASNRTGSTMQGASKHEAALARAEAAMGRGDAVSVSDLVPPERIETLDEFLKANRIKDERPGPEVEGRFLGWVRQAGGIDFAQKWDITNERGGITANPGGIFRKNDRGVDDLALQAEEAGYLRPGEGSDSGRFIELVQDAVNGNRVLTLEEQGMKAGRDAQANEYGARLEAVETRLKLLGVDTAPAKGNLLALEAYAKAHEPQLLGAAMDEIRAATDYGPEFDALQARARGIADDIVTGERTRQQYEADVAPLSPVMRRMVDEILNTQREQPAPVAQTGKPRDLQAEVIALRKQEIVLKKLMECLDG